MLSWHYGYCYTKATLGEPLSFYFLKGTDANKTDRKKFINNSIYGNAGVRKVIYVLRSKIKPNIVYVDVSEQNRAF